MESRKNNSFLSKISNPKYVMVYATVGIFLVIYAFGAIVYGDKNFVTWRTLLVSMFGNNAYYGISAVGMTMVLITGGIDLSVAAIASLTGMIVAYGNSVMGVPVGWCILVAFAYGIGLGALMGWVIHYLNVPPFITTLTGMFLSRGICALISRESISVKNELIDNLAGFKIYIRKAVFWGDKIKPVAYISLSVLVFIAMIIIGAILMKTTRFGRNIYAIGGNEQSAKLMGLPVGRTKVIVYAFNGFCSVLAGLAFLLEVKSGWSLSLQGGELEVITCAVIGGTLLTGGVGYILGTMFGVLLKSVIPTLITFQGNLNSWWGKIATGLLLLLFIVIQRVVVITNERRKKKA